MVEFKESKFYKLLQELYMNNNKETCLQMWAELYKKSEGMIDESNLLNFYCNGIYDSTKALTETEIIMKVLEKLNLVILNFNDLECQMMKRMTALEKEVNYYLDTGIKTEIRKQLDEMIENGTIKSIINDVIIENYN